MLNSFKKLSPREVKMFGLFLSSPYFTANKNVLKVYKYLSRIYPDISEKALEKKTIARESFRNEKYDDSKTVKAMSDFRMLFERFLVQLRIDSSEEVKKGFLLSALRDIKDIDRFKRYDDQIKKESVKKFSKDFEHYQVSQMHAKNSFEFGMNTEDKNALKSLRTYLWANDLFIIYLQLLSYYYSSIYEDITPRSVRHEDFLKKEIMEHIKKNEIRFKKSDPNIFMLYSLILVHDEGDKEILNAAEEFYKKNIKKFSADLIRLYVEMFFSFYFNRYYKSIGDQQENIIKLFNHFDLNYMKNEPSEHVLINGFIHFNDFITAVNVGCSYKKFSWVKNYIKKNKKFLAPATFEDTCNICEANLNFNLGKYEKALTPLNKISNKVNPVFLGSKILKTMVFYEKGDLQGVRNIVININEILRKKNKRNENTPAYRTFVHYITKLANIHNLSKENMEREIKILLKDIKEEKKFITRRSWFIEKLEGLSP